MHFKKYINIICLYAKYLIGNGLELSAIGSTGGVSISVWGSNSLGIE